MNDKKHEDCINHRIDTTFIDPIGNRTMHTVECNLYSSLNDPNKCKSYRPFKKSFNKRLKPKIPVTREKFDITIHKSIKIKNAIRVIDEEINTIKKQLDKTYNIQKQKELSYQLTALYITKEYLLQKREIL